ncbi:MAG: BA14K family protein [Pseudomonadota bacterium]
MTAKTSMFKSTALILAGSFVASAVMPVATASAHDRRNIAKHHGYGTPLTKNGHRKFHKRFGPGHHGRANFLAQNGYNADPYYNGHHSYGGHYHQPQPKVVYKKKKRNKGDLVAAGIIGLAVGAIIASEASKRRSYQPNYQYHTPQTNNHIPLQQYNNHSNTRYSEPNVITYNDGYSLEPWTPGWERWCDDRYRSFNKNTGTFRGYDGKDHFCVPK